VNSAPSDLSRLQRRRLIADRLTLTFAVLAFAWIPAALVLIHADKQLRPLLLVLRQLWPLVLIPFSGLLLSACWRVNLIRRLKHLNEKNND
jgi:hypothetical protein